MELKCANCGQALPGENARFCNNCGTLVPSHPFSPRSKGKTGAPAGAEKKAPTGEHEEKPLPELGDVPPAWMERLEKGPAARVQDKPSPEPEPIKKAAASVEKTSPPTPTRPRPQPVGEFSWPDPVTHTIVKESSVEDGPQQSRQPSQAAFSAEDLSRFAAVPQSRVEPFASPNDSKQPEVSRDWPQEPTVVSHSWQDEQSHKKEDIDAIPTQTLQASDMRKEKERLEEQERQRREDFEQLHTTPLQAQAPSAKAPHPADEPTQFISGSGDVFPSVERGNSPRPSQADALPKPERANTAQAPQPPVGATPFLGLDAHPPFEVLPSTPRPQQRPDSGATPFLGLDSSGRFPGEIAPETPRPPQSWQSAPASSIPATPMPASPSVQPVAPAAPVASKGLRSKLIAAVVAVALVLVIALSVVWLTVGHPFSQPLHTWQTFSDTSVNASMEIPDDWSWKADAAQHSVTIANADSAHADAQTGFITIAVSDQNPGDLAKYLNQQATKLSMDNMTPSDTLTFGGEQWKQLHGTLEIKGANYTGILLATMHNNHLYLLTLEAPQKDYEQYEHSFFSHARSTFKFL